MVHTKQTPRNPNVDRPATAIGSDAQPERRTTHERRETAPKTSVAKTSETRQSHYWRN